MENMSVKERKKLDLPDITEGVVTAFISDLDGAVTVSWCCCHCFFCATSETVQTDEHRAELQWCWVRTCETLVLVSVNLKKCITSVCSVMRSLWVDDCEETDSLHSMFLFIYYSNWFSFHILSYFNPLLRRNETKFRSAFTCCSLKDDEVCDSENVWKYWCSSSKEP